MVTPIAVDFPLRGEWIVPQTPGTKIPSHGTDMFGERYAKVPGAWSRKASLNPQTRFVISKNHRFHFRDGIHPQFILNSFLDESLDFCNNTSR